MVPLFVTAASTVLLWVTVERTRYLTSTAGVSCSGSSCEDAAVVPVGKSPERLAAARLGTRTAIVVTTTRRQFAHRWSTPRSRVWQVALAPVFLGCALLIVVLFALALAILFALSIVAVVGLTIVGALRPRVSDRRS